jgi:hypothetical protein
MPAIDSSRIVITAAVVAVSVAISPSDWRQWIDFLLDHRAAGGLPLAIRLGVATLLVVVAAVQNRQRLLVVAALFALPVIGGSSVLTMLAALPRLEPRPALRRPQRPRPCTTAVAGAEAKGHAGHADGTDRRPSPR